MNPSELRTLHPRLREVYRSVYKRELDYGDVDQHTAERRANAAVEHYARYYLANELWVRANEAHRRYSGPWYRLFKGLP